MFEKRILDITGLRQNRITNLILVYLVLKLIPVNNAYYQYILTILLLLGILTISRKITVGGLSISVILLIQIVAGWIARRDFYDSFFPAMGMWLSWLLFFSLAQSIQLDSEHIQKIFRLIIMLVSISIAYNIIIHYSSMINFLTFRYDVAAMKTIFKSFFPNVNNFAFYLYMGFCILLFQVRKWYSFGKFTVLLIIGVSLILTLSKASIMSTMLFSAVLIMSEKRSKRTVAFTTVLIIACICLMYMILFPHNKIATQYYLAADAGLNERLEIWKYGWSLFKERPFFGYGFGNSEILYVGKWGKQLPWHNAFFECVISGGVFYLIQYLAGLRYVLKAAVSIRHIDRSYGNFYISFALSYVAYSMFEDVQLFSVYPLSCAITVIIAFIPFMHLNNLKSMSVNSI